MLVAAAAAALGSIRFFSSTSVEIFEVGHCCMELAISLAAAPECMCRTRRIRSNSKKGESSYVIIYYLFCSVCNCVFIIVCSSSSIWPAFI